MQESPELRHVVEGMYAAMLEGNADWVAEALSDSDLDPQDPLGLRGVDRRTLGLDREGLGLDRESLSRGVKPVSPGGPGSANGNGAQPAAAAAAADDVPLDPDAT